LENDWFAQQLRFDQVEKLRNEAEKKPDIGAHIQILTGNDPELTQRILKGPSEDDIEALKDSAEDDPIRRGFDKVWGIGAAEHYENQKDLWDHLLEIPGAVVRGVAEAAASGAETAVNTPSEVYNALDDLGLNIVGPLFGLSAETIQADSERRAAAIRENKVEWDADTILRGAISAPETMTGQMTEGIVQFAAPFFTGLGATSKLGLLANVGKKGHLLAATIIGAVTDFTFFDADEPLITTALADYFNVESEIVDNYLRFDEDDSDFSKRIRRAAEGTLIGGALDIAMMGVGAAFRKVRSGKIDAPTAAKEIEQILNDLDPADIALDGKVVPENLDEVPLWHLESRPLKEAVEEAVEAAPAAEARAGAETVEGASQAATEAPTEAPKDVETPPVIEQLPPKYAEAAEANGIPAEAVLPTPAEHQRAIAIAKRVYIAARDIDATKAWESVAGALREFADTLGEASVRTVDELSVAVKPYYDQVAKWVDSGDIDSLTKFANSNYANPTDLKLRSSALHLIARSLRQQTDKMADIYDAMRDAGKLGSHDEAVMRDVLHQQIQFAMEVEALHTNLRSFAGAFLGQGAGHMDVLRVMQRQLKEAGTAAKAAGKDAKEVKKALRSAKKEAVENLRRDLKAQAGAGNKSFAAKKYRELVKEGVDPLVAYKHVKAIAAEADYQGVNLNAKPHEVQPRDATKLGESAQRGVDLEEKNIPRLFRGLEQWRYNAMLSGFRTHETNFLSALWQMTSRIAYEAAWGAVRVDRSLVLGAGRKFAGMTMGMRESVRYAFKAYKEMKPVIDEVTAFERFDPVYRNHFLTYPTRIMLGSDQFIKQLTYRGEIRAQALHEADMAGLTGAKRQAYLDKKLKDAFTEGGAATDMLALNRSNEVTFQKHYDPNSKYFTDRAIAATNEAFSNHYLGRFAFPFMRIMFRLTEDGIRLTPGLRDGLSLGWKLLDSSGVDTGGSKFYDELMGKHGKQYQAKAAGEFAVGVALTGWTMALAMEGRITGSEEGIYLNDLLEEKIQPRHTIRFGEGDDAYLFDYSRFEPLAFPMKFYANLLSIIKKEHDAADRGEREKWEGDILEYIGMFSYAFARQVSSNSFMESMESLIEAMETSYDDSSARLQPVQSILDSYIPNIVKKLNAAFDDSGDTYYAKPLTWDAFARHFSSILDMESVDNQRNLFTGEKKVQTEYDDISGFTSFVGKPVYRDPVMEMLDQANYHTGIQPRLTHPTGFGFPGVDLRDVPQDGGGRSLYDQYLDVFSKVTDANGMTYRDRMTVLAEQLGSVPEEKRWGNHLFKGAAAEAISKIKNEFEGYAKLWMENNSKSYGMLHSGKAAGESRQKRRDSEVLEFFRSNQ